jgi:hypothetical protein
MKKPKKKKEYGHGGGMMMKKPMAENYPNDPMRFFNDVAMHHKQKMLAEYGKEMAKMGTEKLYP